jgi:hypothetical protein
MHNRAENANPTPNRSLPHQRRQIPRTRHPSRSAEVLPQQPPPLSVRKRHPGLLDASLHPRAGGRAARRPVPIRLPHAGRPQRIRGSQAHLGSRNPHPERRVRPSTAPASCGNADHNPDFRLHPPGRRNRHDARSLSFRRGRAPPLAPGAGPHRPLEQASARGIFHGANRKK